MNVPYKPLKKLSQNFLRDPFVIEKICSEIDALQEELCQKGILGDSPQKRCVEIGPGQGALTLPLLKRGYGVTAIDKDQRSIHWLQSTSSAALNMVVADVLRWSPPEDEGKSICVGNLPYAISSDFLMWFISKNKVFPAGIFMLQNEVVDRISAPPGCGAYGRLSVRMQLSCQVQKLFLVPAGAFFPKPQVDSAVFAIRHRGADDPFLNCPEQVKAFEAFTHVLFSARRKTLQRALRQQAGFLRGFGLSCEFNGEDFHSVCVRLDLDPTCRAEVLSPLQIWNLFLQLLKISTG